MFLSLSQINKLKKNFFSSINMELLQVKQNPGSQGLSSQGGSLESLGVSTKQSFEKT